MIAGQGKYNNKSGTYNKASIKRDDNGSRFSRRYFWRDRDPAF